MFELRDVDIVEVPGEKFCITFSPSDKNVNINGSVHGGVLYLLCDEAIGRYVTAMGRKGAAADANIHYYRPGKPGEPLFATVSDRKVGKKLGIFLVELTNGEGKLLADALFTVAFAE
mgnify:CR=1 FL=1